MKLSSLGDVVHAIGAASILGRIERSFKVTWAVKKNYFPLFRDVCFVDELVGAKELLSIPLKRFDVVVDLQGLLKTAAISLFTGKKRCGFDRKYLKEPLASLAYTDRVSPQKLHVVEMMRELICESLSIEDDGVYDFCLRVSEDEKDWARRRFPEKYAVLLPSAAWPTKALSVSWCRRFVGMWLARSDVPLFLLCGIGDEGRLRGLSPWLLSNLPLRKAMAVLEGSLLVIGPDTGLLHVAAALGKRCLGLYGPSLWERNAPFGDAEVIKCLCPSAGCFKRSCDSSCTSTIPVEQVIDKALELLAL